MQKKHFMHFKKRKHEKIILYSMHTYVSVLVTHPTRIQCLLDPFRIDGRWKQCAILKLEMGPTTLKLSMVHSGENDEVGPYFVKDQSEVQRGNKLFEPVIIVNDLAQLRNTFKLTHALKDNYVFYIVNHGKARQGMILLDPSLTDESHLPEIEKVFRSGVDQSDRAGIALRNELRTSGNRVDYMFVSDLKRTHQTARILKTAIGYSKMPIVLPCAHEVTNRGTIGNCDEVSADTSYKRKMSRENYSSCIASDGIESRTCSPVDWRSVYLPFYGDKVRSQEDSVWGVLSMKRRTVNQLKQQCRNTSMIAMAIYYISHKRMPIEEYIFGQRAGTRKKKRRI